MKATNYSKYLKMSPVELRKHQWKRGWMLSYIGIIVYVMLRLLCQTPKDYNGICPYFEVGHHSGGVSFGWFFICGKNCSNATRKHEVGHSIQNAAVGGFKMVAYSIGSVARYWWRKIFGAKTSYDSWFFEGDATRIGTEYVNNIVKSNNH